MFVLLYFSIKRLRTTIFKPKAKLLISLLIAVSVFSPSVYADSAPKDSAITEPNQVQALTTQADLELQQCEQYLISKDIENRYQKIQKRLERDFSQGAPNQLKKELVTVRKEIDNLSLKFFDIDKNNHQEINLLVQQTLAEIEKMIHLLPQASQLVPQMRSQYVVPFTNISSIKADQQECMMKVAVENAKKEIDNSETDTNTDDNVYSKLTSELNQLNKNLYLLETTDVQKYIGLRAELLANLEQYNKEKVLNPQLVQKIPTLLNSVQLEIEKMLPGLQLSKKYYSIVQ